MKTLIHISVTLFPLDEDYDPDLHNLNPTMQTLRSTLVCFCWTKIVIKILVTLFSLEGDFDLYLHYVNYARRA